MADPFIGQIALFAFNFAPRGWALCEGQLLPLSQNVALFSILGTIYGGDGKSTFALPDLRGSAALAAGQGPGLSEYFPGGTGGAPTVALDGAEMPAHAHGFAASTDQASAQSPDGNLLARATRLLASAEVAQVPGPTQVQANFYSPNAERRAHGPVVERDRRGRREPAAQQHAASSGAQFLHRAPRGDAAARLTREVDP
jgi:microcystin-dependent protein